MGRLINIVITLLASIYERFRIFYFRLKLRSKSTKDIFTNIYNSNTWSGKDSISGVGSDFEQTKVVIEELPKLFNDYKISILLDIPCGDFNWMEKVDLNNIDYIGADIVEELILENNDRYASEHLHFSQLDLLYSGLPKTDLVFCRDCFVHLSYADIFLALKNICESGSEYLLTTTFTERKKNQDIPTGHWRTLNLQMAPFVFPEPLKIINENCSESSGSYKDKSLALWRIRDIQSSITRAPILH